MRRGAPLAPWLGSAALARRSRRLLVLGRLPAKRRRARRDRRASRRPRTQPRPGHPRHGARRPAAGLRLRRHRHARPSTRIAREGVRFDHAATTVPFTLPAHSSMLTGLYPPRHGVRENVGFVLAAGAPTLAERLRDGRLRHRRLRLRLRARRRAGAIGRGFDTYCDDFDPARDRRAPTSPRRSATAPRPSPPPTRWLDERPAGKPFFLWLHLYDAHDPYTPPRAVRLALPRAARTRPRSPTSTSSSAASAASSSGAGCSAAPRSR